MSQEENINFSARWDLSPQGYGAQSKDFQDWEICGGNQQSPALCCDRSSDLICVAGFVHRDLWCGISCGCAHSVRQG